MAKDLARTIDRVAKELAWKASRAERPRGFESHALRQHEKNRTWYLQVPRSVLSFLWKVSKNSMKDTVAGTTDPICQGFVFST